MSVYDEVTPAGQWRRGSAKWRLHGPEVLAAWIAEMDFPVPAVVDAALRDALARGYVGYPPADIDTGLPDALSAWAEAEWALRIPPEQIRVVPDVLRGAELAIELFSEPGSAVVLPTPSYPPFFQVIAACGRSAVEVPLVCEGGRLALDTAAIGAALEAGAGTVVLCNPYNPVGRVFTREELAALARVVDAAGARVVADEVHAPLVYPGVPFATYASVSPEAASHSVTLTSASKGWNVAGLKCAAVLLAHEADARAWSGLPRVRTNGASTLGIAANVAAFRWGQPWLAETLEYLDRGRHLLGELLSSMLADVVYQPPEGTYLAWLDCRALGLERPAEHFLAAGGVALSEGSDCGAPGTGFVRLNMATSHALLEQIVERMAAAVRGRGRA